MSEKRFIIVKSIENLYALVDKEKEVEQIIIFSLHKEQLDVVCDLLNEQQATIQSLKEENEQLRKELGDCEKFRYQVFKRMNDEYIKERSIK